MQCWTLHLSGTVTLEDIALDNVWLLASAVLQIRLDDWL